MDKSHAGLLADCDVDTFRSGGKGGQHQNKTESGVRLRHRPSGLAVACRQERSQYLNKMRCIELLQRKLAKLAEKPAPRLPTKVPKGVKNRIREAKRHRSRAKVLRKRPKVDDE